MSNYENGLSVIHITEPTPVNIRIAMQSLIGRANYPFEDHFFHGLIEKSCMKRIFGEATAEAGEISLNGTGVVFKPVTFLTGALIMGRSGDPLSVETR